MKAEQKIIIFAYWFGTGLMQPVLSLMLIARGCTLQTLPLALTAYGITALLLELPSGIYADRKGRKHTFLFAILLYALSFALMFLASGVAAVMASMIIYGASRAFASGSLDALIIDDFLERKGEEQLHRITSQLSVTIGCGIAAGSLLGGALPADGSYSLHIILRVILLGFVGAMVAWRIPRDTPQPQPDRVHTAPWNITGIRMTPPLLRLLISIVGLTGIMAAIETYWTPALKAIDPGSANMMLGMLSAASFFLLTLGSMAMGHIKVKTTLGRWNLYFTLQVSLGIMAVLLALQNTVLGFGLAFLGFYLLMGADDVQEQTLLNSLADSSNRAATLSAASLMSQLGGILASVFCSATVLGVGFSGVWMLIGGTALVIFTILWLLTLYSRKNL